jgi:hypothetical protein
MCALASPALRPLTPDEETLLRWSLEHGSKEAKSYLPQIEGMRAKSSCTCGCPSVALVVSDDAPSAHDAKDRIVVDLLGQTAEGIGVGLLIFQDGGKLSELEVYPWVDEGAFGLPTVESLVPFRVDDRDRSKS